MAKPVAYRVFTPPDAREELKRKIDEAPAEHADAILSGYRLLEQAHESGTLELLRGALAAQDSIINHVVGLVSQPDEYTGCSARHRRGSGSVGSAGRGGASAKEVASLRRC